VAAVPATVDGITNILLAKPSIEFVGEVQSQWVGPSTFSYKAEVDFDGTYLAANLQPKWVVEAPFARLDAWCGGAAAVL
jgi:hypothetical protein